jgi:hypothetical protein
MRPRLSLARLAGLVGCSVDTVRRVLAAPAAAES